MEHYLKRSLVQVYDLFFRMLEVCTYLISKKLLISGRTLELILSCNCYRGRIKSWASRISGAFPLYGVPGNLLFL
ncbi:hypothetical protein BMS3Abin13_01544 [bacterium BMS3Abin13]|nr:hypothetical protein BMS3Abin13_01544 [bacterium BMS3Abin13]